MAELQRKFEREEPEPPTGIIAGWVQSPIREDRAAHMSDEQWLGAMRRHAEDEGNRFDMTGGAYQLGRVLQDATKRDPDRFARLALRLDDSFNRNYLEAILMGLGEADAPSADLAYAVIRHAASVGGHERWIARPLVGLDNEPVPTDVIEIVLAHALGRRRLDADEQPRDDDMASDMDDPFTSGLNTARGGNAWALARLVAFDRDGSRAEVVSRYLDSLASDASPEVRTCVAELMRYLIRWDRAAVAASFETLARDRDLALVTSNPFGGLVFALAAENPEAILPIASDMLESDDARVREHGAHFLTLLATEADRRDLLERIDGSADPAIRRGVAFMLAARLRWSDDPSLGDVLARYFDDDEDEVREAAATIAGNLRGEPLARYSAVLTAFINSRAINDPSQLLLTLDHAPAPEHELIVAAAEQITAVAGDAVGDIRTGMAGDARYLTRLLLRSYSVTDDPELRRRLLDVIDRLLELNAYGLSDAVDELQRSG